LTAAKVKYDAAVLVETELEGETAVVHAEQATADTLEEAEVQAAVDIITATKAMTTEDIAEVEVQKQEEEMVEKKIASDESAANAQKAKNALNSYYRTIVKKLTPVKFDGSQDLQILAKIKTTSPNGTLFAHAFPAKWGAKWESGGSQGQAKMLFLRNGKLCFDIGWVGVVTGTTNLADGKPHKIGLRYTKAENKFSLVVDGNVEASGLHAVDDRVGAEFMIGLSVGHSARAVASMAPIYTGSIDDFRVSATPA